MNTDTTNKNDKLDSNIKLLNTQVNNLESSKSSFESFNETIDISKLKLKQEENRLKVFQVFFRSFIVFTIVIIAGGLLFAYFGDDKSEYNELIKAVLSSFTPLIGFMLGYYFKDSGK